MNLDLKLERRYRILLALRSTEWVSAQSLAETFEISVRTIYRDIEDLLSYGIPIEGVRGPEGGYRLRPGLPIDPALLSSVDSFALYLEQDRSASAPAEVPQNRLREVDETSRSPVFVDVSDWYWRGRTSEWLDDLKTAIADCNAVQIDYRERGSAETRNILVMPYGLAWKAGEWYLVGPELNCPIRRFSLGRIDGLTTTALTFRRPTDFNIGATWAELAEDFGRGDQAVVILASEQAKPQLMRLHLKPDSKVEQQEDGSVQITLFVDSWRWLIPLIASFGSAVKVLEPFELRDEVIRFLEGALSSYYENCDSSAEPPKLGQRYRWRDQSQQTGDCGK